MKYAKTTSTYETSILTGSSVLEPKRQASIPLGSDMYNDFQFANGTSELG